MNELGQSLNEINSNRNIPLTKDMNDAGQMPFAFQKRQKLWITSLEDKKVLMGKQEYKDWWNDVNEIPPYKDFDQQSTRKTSIIIPLVHDFRINEIIGVVNFESEHYLEPTTIAKETLEKLSTIISKAIRLQSIRTQFQESTRGSLSSLKSELDTLTFRLRKPKLFLGYPDKAEDDVMGCIKAIIDTKYSNKILLCDWKAKFKPNQITQEILDEIHQSRYGIYYFSEKDDSDSPYAYKDNNNVIFEAGLHQGRDNSCNWILIREKDSEETPFDLSTFRRIDVPRNTEGNLEKEVFRESLKNAFDAMIEL